MSEILHKGIEYRRRITVTEDDGTATPLAGLDVVVEIRRRTSGANLLTYSVGAGITLVAAGAGGLADLVIPVDASLALDSAGHLLRILVEDQVALDWVKLNVRD
jgi:hypothetical protein